MALRSRLPPRQCEVFIGHAVSMAGKCCRYPQLQHLDSVWIVGFLATLPPPTSPILATIIVNSVGNY
jgi:hypothetical protein